MSKSVLGVFMGGPWDGKRQVTDGRRHTVEVMSSDANDWRRYVLGAEDMPVTVTVTTHHYRLVDIGGIEPGDWTLYALDGMSTQEIVDKLVRYYRSND